jgi:DNA-binding protein H-NS
MTIKTREQIKAERAALDEQEREIRASDLAAVRAKIDEMASEDGMSFDSFVAANLRQQDKPVRKPAGATRGNAEPKYANPNNAGVTWSGRGPAPAWFMSAIQAGFSKEDLEIRKTQRATNGHASA